MHAVGGRHIFPLDRDAEDHVYCMFEFPGPGYDPGVRPRRLLRPGDELSRSKNGIPGYDEDPNKKIVVTYSSINGNGFGGYGEVVMGTKGTLVLEREQEVMLYKDSDTTTTRRREGRQGRPHARHAGQRQGPRRSPRRPSPAAPSAAATPKRSSTGPGAFAIRPPRTSPAARPRSPWATRSSP